MVYEYTHAYACHVHLSLRTAQNGAGDVFHVAEWNHAEQWDGSANGREEAAEGSGWRGHACVRPRVHPCAPVRGYVGVCACNQTHLRKEKRWERDGGRRGGWRGYPWVYAAYALVRATVCFMSSIASSSQGQDLPSLLHFGAASDLRHAIGSSVNAVRQTFGGK